MNPKPMDHEACALPLCNNHCASRDMWNPFKLNRLFDPTPTPTRRPHVVSEAITSIVAFTLIVSHNEKTIESYLMQLSQKKTASPANPFSNLSLSSKTFKPFLLLAQHDKKYLFNNELEDLIEIIYIFGFKNVIPSLSFFLNSDKKYCRWWDSNHRSLVSEEPAQLLCFWHR